MEDGRQTEIDPRCLMYRRNIRSYYFFFPVVSRKRSNPVMLETFPPTQLHRSIRGFTEENQDLTGTPVPHRSTHTAGKGPFTPSKNKS